MAKIEIKSEDKKEVKSEKVGEETRKENEEKKTRGDFQDQLEGYADSIVKAVNYDRLKLWKEVLFHPTETLSSEIKNADLGRGAKDVFIASIPQIFMGILGSILFLLYFGMVGVLISGATLGLGLPVILVIIIFWVLLIVLSIIAPIINWLITSVMQYVMAKILGGKGDFKTHAYLVALVMASITVVIAIFLLMEIVMSFIPCIGWLFSMILRALILLIGLYNLYLQYKVVRLVHGFDRIKALITILLPILVLAALFVIAALLIYFVIIGSAFLPLVLGILKIMIGSNAPSS
jgi:hypothetical protein